VFIDNHLSNFPITSPNESLALTYRTTLRRFRSN